MTSRDFFAGTSRFSAVAAMAGMLLCALAPTDASAATRASGGSPRILSDKAGKAWKHKESGIALPGRLADAELAKVTDGTLSESDVFAEYNDAENDITTSVFVFRAGVPDASLWLDRTLMPYRLGQGSIGTLDFAKGSITTVTPPGGAADSGVFAAYPASGKGIVATAAAILPVDNWLVAIRMSSRRPSAADLSTRMRTAIGQIKLPSPKSPDPAAYAIEDCADGVAFAEAPRADAGEATGGALLSLVVDGAVGAGKSKPQAAAVAPAHFCRDQGGSAMLTPYRRIGAHDGYVVAGGDAGFTIAVQPSLITQADPTKPPLYEVKVLTVEKAAVFRGFTAVPTLAQAQTVLRGERPIGQVGRTPATSGQVSLTGLSATAPGAAPAAAGKE
jgi:hypothetical protein